MPLKCDLVKRRCCDPTLLIEKKIEGCFKPDLRLDQRLKADLRLYQRLKADLRLISCFQCHALIRVSDQPSIKLHKGCNWTCDGLTVEYQTMHI